LIDPISKNFKKKIQRVFYVSVLIQEFIRYLPEFLFFFFSEIIISSTKDTLVERVLRVSPIQGPSFTLKIKIKKIKEIIRGIQLFCGLL
jgi:hypothetical protein